MSTEQKPRLGRPVGSEFPELIHIRISGEMSEWLDVISDDRLDRPTVTQLVREAIADYIEKYRRNESRA